MLGRSIGAVADGGDGAMDGSHVDNGALASTGLEHRRDLIAHAIEDAIGGTDRGRRSPP